MKKVVLATAAVTLGSSIAAWASSDAAWNTLFAKANGTCIGQSRMISPQASAPVVFDDTIGKIAVLLREPIRGKSKTMREVICLYDKTTGKAAIEEYHWLGK